MAISTSVQDRVSRARLSLDGLSVGDAYGQRFFKPDEIVEGLIASRAEPAAPWGWTDDTAMALGVVEVLLRHGRVEQDDLAETFARNYMNDRHRGYGAGQHRLLTEVHEGKRWQDATHRLFGGMGSFGNGAAMRVAPLGAYFADDVELAAKEARLSAEVTHGHPEGQEGAVAVAVATACAWRLREEELNVARAKLFEVVLQLVPQGDVREGIEVARDLPIDATVVRAVHALGNGSLILAKDTVPFTLWCATRHMDDYRAAIWTTVSGLGDRDTTCAIVGGIVAGARSDVPKPWLENREPLPTLL